MDGSFNLLKIFPNNKLTEFLVHVKDRLLSLRLSSGQVEKLVLPIPLRFIQSFSQLLTIVPYSYFVYYMCLAIFFRSIVKFVGPVHPGLLDVHFNGLDFYWTRSFWIRTN